MTATPLRLTLSLPEGVTKERARRLLEEVALHGLSKLCGCEHCNAKRALSRSLAEAIRDAEETTITSTENTHGR